MAAERPRLEQTLAFGVVRRQSANKLGLLEQMSRRRFGQITRCCRSTSHRCSMSLLERINMGK